MKHLAHLVWFEFKANLGAVAVWALVLGAHAWLLVSLAPGMPPTVTNVIDGLRLGLSALTVAIVVQRDPLVGTNAFWRTRPIPRWALMTAKLIVLGTIVVVLPALMLAAVLSHLGLAPADAARGARLLAVDQARVMLYALPAAALTATMGQFALLCFACLALGMVFAGAVAPTLSGWRTEGPLAVAAWVPAAAWATVPLGCLAVAVHQYLTLRTRRSIGIVAGVLVLAAAVAVFVKGTVEVRAAAPVDPRVVNPGAIVVHIDTDGQCRTTPCGGGVRGLAHAC